VERDRPAPTAQRGLYLLDAQHGVPLVGTAGHQDVLARHAPAAPGVPVQVVVELSSPDGGPEVEARLHGEPVGLLGDGDAAWYRPLLERAAQQGVRPGCEGHVRVGGSGELEVELFLPAGETPELVGPTEFSAPAAPAPVGAGPSRRSRVPIWCGLGAALLIIGVVAFMGYGQWTRLVERLVASAAAPTSAAPSPSVAEPPPLVAAPPSPSPTPAPPPPALTSTSPRPPITNGGCDPNYSGACVPIASHVDCAGPGRSGPLVVRGPFRVTGTDLYQLDPDHDGIACGPVRPSPTIPPPPPAPSELSTSATSTTTTTKRASDDSDDEN
jgi:hypothetical protein